MCLAAVANAAGATRADAPTVAVTQTLTGLNDITAGGYEPPDVQVAAGPGFVVEMVNLAARTWRTATGAPAQQAQTIDLATFFGTGGDRLTDPRVIYDTASSRWFASIADVDSNSVKLAVSHSTDPTAAWSTYSFAAAGCPDQPRLGVADGIVVLAADVFSSCDESFAPLFGAELWVVNKAQLVAGAPTVASFTYGPDHAYTSLAPVQSLSPTGTEYAVSVDSPSSRVVHLLTVDGIPPAAVRVQAVASLPISPLTEPPPGQQPSSSGSRRPPVIETNDNRVLDSVWEDGKLWFSANDGCVPSGDTSLRSCGRVVELATATRTVTWDTELSQPGAHVFYPALQPDGSGNLVLVYGESSVAILPELVTVARLPDGTFTAPAVFAQSAGTYNGDRFGDYFGAARDPSSPGLVWVAGEQGVDIAGTRGWGTSVASVQVNAAGAVTPPTINGSVVPGVRAQAVAGRVGSTVRLAYKVVDDSTGVREKVTVTLKKKVVFKATTAALAVRGGQVYYVRWHPAKKLRGTFTWCVTSVAADGTQSPQSCSTLKLR